MAKGYSLIEMMVVLVILAILASIGIAAYHAYTLKTRMAVLQHTASQLVKRVELYYQTENQWPASANQIGYATQGDNVLVGSESVIRALEFKSSGSDKGFDVYLAVGLGVDTVHAVKWRVNETSSSRTWSCTTQNDTVLQWLPDVCSSTI